MSDHQTHDELPPTAVARPHLDVLLVRRLADTDYRTGRLHVPEPVPEAHLSKPADATPAGWVTRDRVETVLHPARGALLLRDVTARPDEPTVLVRDRIERIHEQLAELQRKLRRRLDESAFWRSRPIALGVGIVVRGSVSSTAIPRRVPDELIVDDTDPDNFEARLEEVFDYYGTPATTPVDEYGPRLVEDLTDSPEWIGNFIGEEAISAMDRGANSTDRDRRAA